MIIQQHSAHKADISYLLLAAASRSPPRAPEVGAASFVNTTSEFALQSKGHNTDLKLKDEERARHHFQFFVNDGDNFHRRLFYFKVTNQTSIKQLRAILSYDVLNID